MFTHTATIGRNVGAVMMHDVAWQAFQGDVLDAMVVASHTSFGAEEISIREGRGSWKGQVESSATLTVLSPEAMPEYRWTALADRLAVLARVHEQEAIAVAVNVESVLIIPTPAYQCHANHTEDCGV